MSRKLKLLIFEFLTQIVKKQIVLLMISLISGGYVGHKKMLQSRKNEIQLIQQGRPVHR